MYQRTKILEAFNEAGLERSPKESVRAFLQFLAESPKICWAEAARVFREKYYDILDLVIPPILKTHDTLIISNLLKYFDPKNEKELGHLKGFIEEADPFSNEATFKILAEDYYAAVGEILTKKKHLPASVKTILSSKKR